MANSSTHNSPHTLPSIQKWIEERSGGGWGKSRVSKVLYFHVPNSEPSTTLLLLSPPPSPNTSLENAVPALSCLVSFRIPSYLAPRFPSLASPPPPLPQPLSKKQIWHVAHWWTFNTFVDVYKTIAKLSYREKNYILLITAPSMNESS